MITQIIISLIGTAGIAYGVWKLYSHYKGKLFFLEEELNKHKYALKSAYVKFGKLFEHFAPFTKIFPADMEKFIFLGQPIDGIAFEDNKIVFIEIKTGNARLSQKQEQIKKLVEENKVEFKEVRYNEHTI